MAGCVLHLRTPQQLVSPACYLGSCKGNQCAGAEFAKVSGRPVCIPALRVAATVSCRACDADSGAAARAMQESPNPLECLPGTEMGTSIQGSDVNLLYGPYMDHFWVVLKEKISSLRVMNLLPEYRVQKSSKGRVHNWLLSGERVRRVRFTYFDGGAAGQAFNSLLYPDTRYDLPLLGIDLLSFGSNKILCVVDFQPLTQDPHYLERHTSVLAPVYERIREQCGHMSTKFFDETQFFSNYLIFYRSMLGARDPTLHVPTGRLWDVYLEYVDIYLKALNDAQSNEDEDARAYVQSRQDAYDQYNAERDPAIKLFNTYFGTETLISHLVVAVERALYEGFPFPWSISVTYLNFIKEQLSQPHLLEAVVHSISLGGCKVRALPSRCKHASPFSSP